MKSVVAFLLALLITGSSLLPGFGIDQTSRLLDLAQHYREHRQQQPTLSFLDFMEMHYGANSEHQKHPNHSHHNLPAVGHAAPVFSPNLFLSFVFASLAILILARTACFRYANLYSFLSVSSLINPPRH
ncbi:MULTISPECIES: hypothetical protein [unclassified Spirosoma]|mgnify:CR=1 FL=1|uniref:hypothetical protein n=1 Tax=unclassified Spirosoma TaxID=2621999 RepID=UPI000964E5DB|nr:MULTISPECIES: hypothetical protein [unclassified Spirosoma]MBN8826356.1 hypothetical protein [Spirosoma sp.]OJW76127.1 MAG: hypothetical protein BGO59_03095 [Spirosoma sp. 48-14]